MKRRMYGSLPVNVIVSGAIAISSLVAQPQQPELQVPDSGTPVFRVDVVSRTINVVNFHHRRGSTELDLKATALSPRAEGRVKVDSRTGATRVEATVEKLNPPQAQGEEFLTYVLWAITPEGRPQNLGEVVIDGGGNAKLQAATELQSFGMIITAEPYFAVTQPSDVVVMEATVGKGTTGTIAPLSAKYELWPKDAYAKRLPAALRVWSRQTGKEAPIELVQAKHAIAVARSMQADKYAADTMKKADTDLQNAEAFFNNKNKNDLKRIQTLSRNAAQLAEDARLIAVKRAEEDRLEAERQAAAARVAAAQTAAEQEARKRELADAERRVAQERELNAKLRAEEAQRQQAAAEAARQMAEEARQAALAEQERLREQKAAMEAEAQRAKALAAELEQKRLEAEEARKAALAEQAKLQAQQLQLQQEADAAKMNAARAEDARLKAEAERAQLRQQLRDQLNAVLVTKETARGLIVNMSDVLFETAKFDLRPTAREKLARVSGILLGHPGLKLEVEGHTDSVGGDAYNQTLSERRAESVRSYLISQGVKPESITAQGFGKTRPVADNNTSAGRQQNRRVEIVVSGDSIQSTGVVSTTQQ